MTKPDLTVFNTLAPLLIQRYERYLPTAFDESMTLLEKVNKIIIYLNQIGELNNQVVEQWNTVMEWVAGDGLSEQISSQLTTWLESGVLADIIINDVLTSKLNKSEFDNFIANDYKLEKVGLNAIKTKDSLYLPNDANLFGYHPDGTHGNLATLQQNDIAQFGDMSIGTLWFESNNYQSLRAPNSPSYQKTDSDGTPIDAGRTIRHQGNSSYHLRVFSTGDHVLTKDVYTDLHTLTNVVHVFPPDAYNNFAYIIPRDGMYTFNLQLKIKNAPTTKGYVRIGISKTTDGVTTETDMADLFYDPAGYGTPFLNTKFDWKFAKDDQVIIKAKPLTETLTIENGTRLQVYQLGDTIQS